MPKATLTFNLPEETEEYTIAMNGLKNYCMLVDLDEYIRKLNKYDERDILPKEEVIDALRTILSDFER